MRFSLVRFEWLRDPGSGPHRSLGLALLFPARVWRRGSVGGGVATVTQTLAFIVVDGHTGSQYPRSTRQVATLQQFPGPGCGHPRTHGRGEHDVGRPPEINMADVARTRRRVDRHRLASPARPPRRERDRPASGSGRSPTSWPTSSPPRPRGWPRGATGRVAVVVPRVDIWFYSAMLASIDRVLTRRRPRRAAVPGRRRGRSEPGSSATCRPDARWTRSCWSPCRCCRTRPSAST